MGGDFGGEEGEGEFFADALQLVFLSLPVGQVEVLAHAADRGDLHAVVAALFDRFRGFPERYGLEKHGIHAKLDHVGFSFLYGIRGKRRFPGIKDGFFPDQLIREIRFWKAAS